MRILYRKSQYIGATLVILILVFLLSFDIGFIKMSSRIFSVISHEKKKMDFHFGENFHWLPIYAKLSINILSHLSLFLTSALSRRSL